MSMRFRRFMWHMNRQLASTIALSSCLTLTPVLAQEKPGVEFTGSGFLTVTAGRIISGKNEDHLGYKGPHFISDWTQGGVYEDDGWQLKPGTKLGLQGSAIFSPQLSVTGQVVSRAVHDGKFGLEWLYGTYKLNDQLTLQVGRKRLPIFSLSETQDVGITYPWVHLPPDTYGWQIVNYNGANLMYSGMMGRWSYMANLFLGGETFKDAGFQKMYSGKDTKTRVRWTNIVGGEISMTDDIVEARVGHIQNDAQVDNNPKYKQKIYTFSLGMDYNNIIAKSDFLYSDWGKYEEHDFAQSFAFGYRIGKFTPMFTYTKFFLTQKHNGPMFGYVPGDEEKHDNRSWSLRYELTTSSALKAQYDIYNDRNGKNFKTYGYVPIGNSRLLTLSYDMVF